MSQDNDKTISVRLPIKLIYNIEKLAVDYGLSRANMVKKLLEVAVEAHGEPTETTMTHDAGHRKLVSPVQRTLL